MKSTTSRVVLLAVLAAAAVVLFIVLSGGDDSSSDDTTTTSETTTGTTATAAVEPTATITVKGGEPVGGVAEIEVSKGDEVTIQVTSDQAGQVHVHGYEIEKPIEPGKPLTVAFTADLDGKYEIEQHFETNGEETGDTQIADLTVNP